MNNIRRPSPLRLHEFLRHHQEGILADWRALGKLRIGASGNLSDEDQRNRVPDLLESIAASSDLVGTRSELAELPTGWPKHHAQQRWDLGFSLEETTLEYGLLREVIFRRLVPHIGDLSADEVTFLNRALDESITEAVVTYVEKASHHLENERERLDVTLQSIGDGVVSTGPEGKINYMNPAALAVLDCALEAVLDCPVNDVMLTLDEETGERLKCAALCATEEDRTTHRGPGTVLQRPDGKQIPIEETAAPIRNARGEFLGAVTTLRDTSKVQSLTQRLGYLATHDALTGLPNRALFVEKLDQALSQAEIDGLRIALFHLDLDQFKDINHTLGRQGGDQLLREVGERLGACICSAGTVCRVASDEFLLFFTGIKTKEHAGRLCDTVHEHIRRPFRIGSQVVHTSASLGISIFPDDGRDPHLLLKHAETAAKEAKAEGANAGQFFAAHMHLQAEKRRQLQTELKTALAAGQLSLHFQPQISLSSGQAIGAEALLRWVHPKLGQVSPDQFIPVAEQNGKLMLELGDWVLHEVCRQARAWQDAGYAPLRVSVNVSFIQLRQDMLVNRLSELMHRYRVRPDQLQLELTESLLMTNIAGASDRVSALKALGVGISVDDFGTGYSSLSYLQEIPLDELKIDRSFLNGIASNREKTAIVRAIISLGQSLNVRVLAEGVEYQSTADFLKDMGCETVQGFLYSRAIPSGVFEAQYLS